MYGIFVYDGVEPIDLGATIGVLSMARRIAPALEYVTIAKSPEQVVCASGFRMVADCGFDTAPPVQDLIVTGGPGWTDVVRDPDSLDFLKRSEARIASICTGAMILDAAGLTKGRRITTKSAVFEGETAPADMVSADAAYCRAVLVEDRGIVTGGGVSMGIDTMFYCLARSHGKAVAEETARVMEYQRALEANRAALGYLTS